MKRKKYIYITKFLAVLLVINSHMDSLYPISALATGGSIGNSLFFLVSGYTWANINKQPFKKWYKEKVERIWLPTVFTNTVYILIFKSFFQLSLIDVFEIFIYPNKSWFCGAILVYALGYYIIAKSDNTKIYKLVAAILIGCYVVWYIFFLDRTVFSVESLRKGGLCRFCFYGLCMLVGLRYRKNEKSLKTFERKQCIFFSVFSFVLIYVSKYAMNCSATIMQLQLLNQVFTLLFVVFLFRALQLSEDHFTKMPAFGVVKWGAEYSWELYLVQTLVIPLCVSIFFPVNIVVSLTVICLLSVLLKRVCDIAFLRINRAGL